MSDSTSYFLTTERIRFRTWTQDDLRLAIKLWSDPAVTRLIADLGDPSERQARERLEREISNLVAHGIQYWPIFLISGGEHLGCCGLRPFDLANGVLEIGAHLFPEFGRQGYATEALRRVIAYAFGELKARALFARHHPSNEGSRRVLAKLGFRYTHDEFLIQTELNHPSYILTSES